MKVKWILYGLLYIMLILGFQTTAVYAGELIIRGYDKAPFMTTNKENPGVCFEVAQEAARRIQLTPDIMILPAKRLMNALVSKAVDAEPCMTHVWRDHLGVPFFYTEPYFYAQETVFMLKGSGFKAKSVHDFKGINLGTGRGYTYDDGFSEAFDRKEILRFDTERPEQNIGKLVRKRIDGIIIEKNTAFHLIKELGYRTEDFEVVYTFSKRLDLSIQVSENKKHLIKALNKALREMKQDGTLDKIINKYL